MAPVPVGVIAPARQPTTLALGPVVVRKSRIAVPSALTLISSSDGKVRVVASWSTSDVLPPYAARQSVSVALRLLAGG